MSWEPPSNIIADDCYSFAVDAKKFNLLNTQGWKQLNRYAKQQTDSSEPSRNRSTEKPRQQRDTSMDGKLVPRDYVHAPQLHVQNGNT